ncbi:SDR family NAD(P)-dependent oxidoreductase [Streptococcus oralis]|uniref:SDR family NAD(P)-dependent oxidoreductase n=1 Tax=Streptococcus oralis TaxID=1303 RepID=UPI0022847277|nr:SDR family NAD(P)-dependent oxidoreductase [Streptococcus oralis]MCY7080269.1 SDR family NAD(P)-dependent oxidoreductase [Streptococcus oralis]
MKKAAVFGGSTKTGVALVNQLIKKGYFVHVFDLVEPPKGVILKEDRIQYNSIDLQAVDITKIEIIKEDPLFEILLVITEFSETTPFDSLSITEIQRIITVNVTSVMKIIHYLYDKILSKQNFYTGVVIPDLGMFSSASSSIYSGSQVALIKMIKDINMELGRSKINNRILSVILDSIEFLHIDEETERLSVSIIEELYKQAELYVSYCDKSVRELLESHLLEFRKFDLMHNQCKENSNHDDAIYHKDKVGYLSGTFDLFHVGHLNLLRRAKEQCDYLIVGVHPNASHKGKKTFISFQERLDIIASISYVDKAVESFPEDSDAWNIYHYDKLFVGSDYKGTERFKNYERELGKKGVEIIYFPYTDGTSSSQLRALISEKNVD